MLAPGRRSSCRPKWARTSGFEILLLEISNLVGVCNLPHSLSWGLQPLAPKSFPLVWFYRFGAGPALQSEGRGGQAPRQQGLLDGLLEHGVAADARAREGLRQDSQPRRRESQRGAEDPEAAEGPRPRQDGRS
eukprot:314298-Alexandrium_andersonii.AAC.1